MFLNPQKDTDSLWTDAAEKVLLPAPKISPFDRHIDWNSWTADEILRRHRVIGPLWSYVQHADGKALKQTRLIWPSGFQRSTESVERVRYLVSDAGRPIVVGLHCQSPKVYIKTCDNQILQTGELKVEGDISRDILTAAQRAKMIELPRILREAPYDTKLFDIKFL